MMIMILIILTKSWSRAVVEAFPLHLGPQETVSQVWKSPSGASLHLIITILNNQSWKLILLNDWHFITHFLSSLKKAGGGPFYVDIDTQENLWFRTTRDWHFLNACDPLKIPPAEQSHFWGNLWPNALWMNVQKRLLFSFTKMIR